jgi:hypothetical protein
MLLKHPLLSPIFSVPPSTGLTFPVWALWQEAGFDTSQVWRQTLVPNATMFSSIRTNGHHLLNQAHDVLLIFLPVGIADNAAPGIGTDPVLIDDPF